MRKHKHDETNLICRSLQSSLERGTSLEPIVSQEKSNPRQHRSKVRLYRVVEPSDISLGQFLASLPKILPHKHEPLLKIAKNSVLWEIFRRKVAEAFCMGDAKYFLDNIPAYPLCFARLTKAQTVFSPVKSHYPYTFDDLVQVAKNLLQGQ